MVYQSDAGKSQGVIKNADASVPLFDPPSDQMFRRSGFGGRGRADPGPGPTRGPIAQGRWQMYVRHRAGSLEAVVAQARLLNLAVTAGVLLLMVASVAALIRLYPARPADWRNCRWNSSPGVSHELRTPLTVIHTAAYNLRGKMADNPARWSATAP